MDLDVLPIGRIHALKIRQDFQEPFVQEGRGLLPYMVGRSVIRFCDRASDSGQRITVAADGDCVPDCVLKPGRFKKSLQCLGYGILTGFIELIAVANGVQCKIKRVIMFCNCKN